MKDNRAVEIKANLERAYESLVAAKELLKNKHCDFSASRAYYVVFYAATALLLKMDLSLVSIVVLFRLSINSILKLGN